MSKQTETPDVAAFYDAWLSAKARLAALEADRAALAAQVKEAVEAGDAGALAELRTQQAAAPVIVADARIAEARTAAAYFQALAENLDAERFSYRPNLEASRAVVQAAQADLAKLEGEANQLANRANRAHELARAAQRRLADLAAQQAGLVRTERAPVVRSAWQVKD